MAARKTAKRATAKAAAPKLDIIDSAQQVWLAGLGALARAQREGPKLFKSLAAEGAKVQDRTSKTAEHAIKNALANIQSAVGERVTEAKGKAQDTWDNVEKIFQSRVQKAIHELGVPTAREIHALTRKVEELTQSVEKLRNVKSAKPAVHKARPASSQTLNAPSTGGPIA